MPFIRTFLIIAALLASWIVIRVESTAHARAVPQAAAVMQ